MFSIILLMLAGIWSYQHLLEKQYPLTMQDAAASGDRSELRRQISRGISINAPGEDGMSPLMVAARAGRATTVEFLLSCGADVNARHPNWGTALMMAAYGGHADIVDALLQHGADLSPRNMIGSNALCEGIASGDLRTVQLLLAAGANLREPGLRVNPLTRAIDEAHPEMLKMLLAAGADAKYADPSGKTARQIAADKGVSDVIAALQL
jgi:ankyrin repeat protein